MWQLNLLYLLFSDGETLDAASDLATIHERFGETWAVKRQDWLFKNDIIAVEISKELDAKSRTYEAKYEYEFTDENLREQANEVRMHQHLTHGFRKLNKMTFSKRRSLFIKLICQMLRSVFGWKRRTRVNVCFDFKVCRSNAQCMMDVALTGQISLAQAFIETEAQHEVFQVFNEVFEQNVPEPEMFNNRIIFNRKVKLEPISAKNIRIKNQNIVVSSRFN